MLIARYADRLSVLVDHIATTLADPLPDPMQREWIAVPSRGIQRWLIEQLSPRIGASPGRTDGIVANIEFGFPGSLATQLLAATQGGDSDPWALERSVWTIMALLVEGEGDPALGPVGRPLEQGTQYDRARRIADLFDRYNVRRPEMIIQWGRGQRVDPDGLALGAREWQAELWTRLHLRIGEPSAAERLPGLLRQLRNGDVALDLPPRLTVFGLSVWPERLIQLACALSTHREVHLLSLCPSPVLTESVLGLEQPAALGTRSEDPSSALAMHPLIASWGRPMREAAVVFAAADVGLPGQPLGQPSGRGGSLLGQIQHQIRNNAAPSGEFVMAADDASLTIHACHGVVRQVEVLHDLLLHTFEDDPTLTEDDVVVLVPQIEELAPIIDAVFGSSAGPAVSGGGHTLRYRITDQALRTTNPFAAAALALVELLVSGRYEASAVADFLALAPVRHRFGFDDDDLRTLNEWIQDTNVRWGLDGQTRRKWNVAIDVASPPNSWRSTVDQLLFGSAVADSPYSLVLGEVPTVPVEGGHAVLAGHLAEVIGLLERASRDVETVRTFTDWRALIVDLIDELLAVPLDDQWQPRDFHAVLATLAVHSSGTTDVTMTFADAARALGEHVQGQVQRSGFRPGTVTFTSMPALRSVPYRVVCILGLDDAAFASRGADGDDLTLLAPRVGDPDDRNDDRQVLLEALLSATERVIVTRTGHDVIRNHEIQETVPLAELWDVVAATVGPQRVAETRARVEFRHTRHAFDAANFATAALPSSPGERARRAHLPRWPFAHDERLLAGARNRQRGNVARRNGLVAVRTAPRHIERVPEVSLTDLHRLLRNPVQFFVQLGLQARIPYREDPFVDTLPVDVNALEGWRTSIDLINARADGVDDLSWLHVMQSRGLIPAGQLAERKLDSVDKDTRAFRDHVLAFEHGSAGRIRETLPISLEIGEQVVTGLVRGVDLEHAQIGRFEYKRAKPHHRLAVWLDLLAVTLAHPDEEWLGALVTRPETSPLKFAGPARVRVRGLSTSERRDRAEQAMRAILALHDRALTEPLPLFTLTSFALIDPDTSHTKVYDAWEKDLEDEYHRLAYGGLSWLDMDSEPPRSDDPQLASGVEPSRIRHWAHYLWDTVHHSAVIADGVPAMAAPDESAVGSPVSR